MIFIETRLPGAYLIDLEPISDERGFFSRQWCEREFAERGLVTQVSQASVAFNRAKATLRGMHWQVAPHAEVKLVRCIRGAIYDVIVDLRLSSGTFGEWIAVQLDEDNRRTLYVPEGFAHGYQTLSAGSEVWYQMSAPYAPQAARGFRWDDPRFGIEWPSARRRVISERDRAWPDFHEGSLAPVESEASRTTGARAGGGRARGTRGTRAGRGATRGGRGRGAGPATGTPA
jgi:dTDP-4-dehydrorhamnose 3,5-epimerase